MPRRSHRPHRLICAAGLLLVQGWASAEGLTGHWQDVWQAIWRDTGALRWDSGAAYLRQTQPALRERIDVPLGYQPSGYRGFSPVGDYARGLSPEEEADGRSRTRPSFITIGIRLDLNALLWGPRNSTEPPAQRYGRLFLAHFQIPATAFHAP